jgi:hypothetical protein
MAAAVNKDVLRQVVNPLLAQIHKDYGECMRNVYPMVGIIDTEISGQAAELYLMKQDNVKAIGGQTVPVQAKTEERKTFELLQNHKQLPIEPEAVASKIAPWWELKQVGDGPAPSTGDKQLDDFRDHVILPLKLMPAVKPEMKVDGHMSNDTSYPARLKEIALRILSEDNAYQLLTNYESRNLVNTESLTDRQQQLREKILDIETTQLASFKQRLPKRTWEKQHDRLLQELRELV